MSDLSRLLDDVYSSAGNAPAAPSWSSDSALEEVFADWVPGEPATAPVEDSFAALAEPVSADSMDQLDALMQQAAALAPEVDDGVDELAGDEPEEAFVPPAYFEEPREVAPLEDSFTPVEDSLAPVEDSLAPVEDIPAPVERHEAPARWVPERLPEASEPAPAPVPLPARTWCRQDDDILPRRLGRRRRKR